MNLAAMALSLLACNAPVLVEAEAFDSAGGWVTDQQSMDVLGSAYLLAHGFGNPVEDATCALPLEAGRWHVYALTHNWTSPWFDGEGPGAFCVIADGDTIVSPLGTEGKGWEWQYAGRFTHKEGPASLRLHDLSGFDGRCDALLLSRSRLRGRRLPSSADGLHRLRLRLNPSYDTPVKRDTVDFAVVGGGIAGMCAALAAARQGLKVALIHDRPVLGGNNSAEVRVHLGGRISLDPYPQLGNLIKEFGHEKCTNAAPAECYADDKKADVIAADKGIALYAPYHAVRSDTAPDGRILRVYARNISTGELLCVEAPLFADCTGDGSLGVMSGADWRAGRESQQEFGEPMAPDTADTRQSGASVLWYSEAADSPQSFPEFDYGFGINEENVAPEERSNWTWETGLDADMINDVERIRDYSLYAIYSNWSFLKNHYSGRQAYSNRKLEWVAYIAGKRESRRLMGPHILTERDMTTPVIYPDGTASASWSIDLHLPDTLNSRHFPGREFRSTAVHTYIEPYPIPFRCLYSRNVSNLMMAGRDISATHVALGSVRVIRTCGMMGEVVGLAASVCRHHDALPSDILPLYWPELDSLMREGAGEKGLPNNQDFCIHGCYPPVN